MPKFLTTGATLECTMGAAPSVFVAQGLPGVPDILGSMPAATIAEFTPTNILPFGMCKSPENPTVAQATAAANGVLTPMPCVPSVVAPWAPPSECTTVNGVALATAESKCACAYGGTISVQTPIQGPEDTE